jgi:hypothetical protein
VKLHVGHMLRVESMVLREIFGGVWEKKLHNEEIHDLFSLPIIIKT